MNPAIAPAKHRHATRLPRPFEQIAYIKLLESRTRPGRDEDTTSGCSIREAEDVGDRHPRHGAICSGGLLAATREMPSGSRYHRRSRNIPHEAPSGAPNSKSGRTKCSECEC